MLAQKKTYKNICKISHQKSKEITTSNYENETNDNSFKKNRDQSVDKINRDKSDSKLFLMIK